MGSVSTSRQLEVTKVQTLEEASFRGLRVSIRGEGITAHSLLTGDFGSRSLVGTVRQPGRVRDLLGTYWAGVYLVTEHFRQSVGDLGATGWFTTPVRIEGIESPLSLLSVTGRCGSMFGVGGEPIAGAPEIGTFIDPLRWDGSDLFMPDNNNSILVLGSTAESLQELRLSNVAFESAGLEPLPRD